MNLGAKAQLIYQKIKESIDNGTASAGTRLSSEKDLIAKYNVSRVTVRAALKKLISDGLVESIQGSGFYVKAFDSSNKVVSFMYCGTMSMTVKVQNMLLEKGCLMTLFSQHTEGWSVELEADFFNRVLAQKQHGVIGSCTPIDPWNETLVEKLVNSGIKFVHTEPYRTDCLPKQDFIFPDYYNAAEQAVKLFIQEGCEKVVFLSKSPRTIPYIRLALKGYKDTVNRLGLECHDLDCFRNGYEDAIDTLRADTSRIGVIALPDSSAVEIANAIGAERVISIATALFEKEHDFRVAVFDREAIFRKAIEVITTPGATIRELVPAEIIKIKDLK